MRKVLRIVAVTAGIVSAVSAFVLGCIYLEDVVVNIKKIKLKISNIIGDVNYKDDEYDIK